MTLIKNKKNWKAYLKLKEQRAENFQHSHSPDMPEKYPFLVDTSMFLDGQFARFKHYIADVEDAIQLITEAKKVKICPTQSRKK